VGSRGIRFVNDFAGKEDSMELRSFCWITLLKILFGNEPQYT